MAKGEGRRNSNLNIAIIHPDLGIGGAERLIVDAAVELTSHGHNVRIFTSHHDRNRCFEETLSDLLLAQHSTIPRKIYRRPIDMVEETTTGMADLILVNSRFTAATFARTFKSLDAKRIQPAVLYPAVNVEQFDVPSAYNLNVLSINRYERKKNIELAISSFAMLHAHEADVLNGHDLSKATLTVVGGFDKRLHENVEYLEELKSLAEKEGLSNRVIFITSCTTAERNTLLSQCLCVLYTPKDEHFGIVPLEAMAAQKPVIACNTGGPVETVIDGVTGFLCESTPKEFSLALAKLISDPDMAKNMGGKARRHVSESFSTKIFGQRLNQYITDIVRRKNE